MTSSGVAAASAANPEAGPMNVSLRALVPGAVVVASLAAAAGDDTPPGREDPRPGPPPGTCAITPAADSIRIPFEVFRDEIRLVGHIGDDEVRILVDNGALWDDLLFFGSPRVDALDLPRAGQALVGGAGSGPPVAADMASGIDLRFAGEDDRVIEFRDQTAILMPYDPGEPNPWEGSEGQISSALFKRFVVGFDFDAGVMTLVRPEAFDPVGQGTEIPIEPVAGSGSWTIPGAITLHDGRRLELDMTMDLGWDEPVAINTGQAHDIEVPAGLKKTRLGVGAQGAIHGYLGTVPVVEIGGHRLCDATATYSTVEDGGAKVDEVMIGLGTFARFHVHFDYPRHRLFVKPNRRFGEPFVPPAAK
jgi:hypothetical protein